MERPKTNNPKLIRVIQVYPIKMSSNRPVRKAAVRAQKRIRTIIENEADLDLALNPPTKPNYDDSVAVLKYLLVKCDNCTYEDERIDVVKQIFQHLVSKPDILIYEPGFRSAVADKIREIQTYIYRRNVLYKKANYDTALDLMKASMGLNIKNSKVRENINREIANIRRHLRSYELWANTELQETLRAVKKVLDEIKQHPEYVLE
jgi:hypothetical protein